MLFLYFVQLLIFSQFTSALPTSFGKYDVQAPLNPDGTVRFFVVGDWGGLPVSPYDTPSEIAVAEAMGKLGLKLNTSFQLALGDNFYYDGVTSSTDPRFQETYEHVFSATALQTPWYVLAGNHDHRGNVSAEIEYGKTSKRWVFPDYFYSFSLWQNETQKKLIDFVMIDTVLLCGGDDLSDWDHVQLQGPRNPQVAEAYWQWIEDQLRQSTAPYLLVNGHFPVYSIAEHGPTQCLIDRLRPLLFKYNATAYLCGHDHNLQHLAETSGGVHMDYFVIGAANFIDPSQVHAKDVPAGSSKFFWAGSTVYGGFGLVEVNSTRLTISLIDHSEQTLYQSSMFPRF